MKLQIAVAVLLIAAAPQKCAKDEDETKLTTVLEENGYKSYEVGMRSAYSDWLVFCKEADSIVLDARIQISEASDCYDDSHTANRGKLKSAIIRSETRLGKLSDHMLQRKKFSEERFKTDESVLVEIESFKKDFQHKQEELNESLLELKKLY